MPEPVRVRSGQASAGATIPVGGRDDGAAEIRGDDASGHSGFWALVGRWVGKFGMVSAGMSAGMTDTPHLWGEFVAGRFPVVEKGGAGGSDSSPFGRVSRVRGPGDGGHEETSSRALLEQEGGAQTAGAFLVVGSGIAISTTTLLQTMVPSVLAR